MSSVIDMLLGIVIGLPISAFLALGTAWLLGVRPSERLVARLTALVSLVSTAAAIAMAAFVVRAGGRAHVISLGEWFTAGDYGFPLRFLVDPLSLAFVLMITTLVGIVGFFSVRYMHRERGFFRFFLLLHLFAAGMLLLVTAGTVDLLFAGWEIVGVTSALLIAYFQERPSPVKHGLRTFVVYRVCDLGLLTAAVLLHHYRDSAFIGGDWTAAGSAMTTGQATLLGLLLVWAAAGKSAQVPFSGWLPRAMEGPTPSSAIFYGALSIHAGAYLLLRFSPLIHQSTWVPATLVVVGAVSAVHGTLVGRAQPDAKSALAYAAVTQVGLVFVEIGLGLHTVALVHVAGHAVVRTLQLLRAPSMLHDYHQLEAAAGPTGLHFEAILPLGARRWLYRLALVRGHHDEVSMRFVVGPVLALARWLDRIDRRWVGSEELPPRRGHEREPVLAHESRGGS